MGGTIMSKYYGSTITIYKKDWNNCDGCNVPLKPVFWETENGIPVDEQIVIVNDFSKGMLNNIDSGLTISLMGGYAEFVDQMFIDEDEQVQLYLCHDCVVKLFSMYNKTKKLKQSHPTTDEAKNKGNLFCCDWSWNLINNKVVHPEDDIDDYRKGE
jgi:hypothetical protein